MPPVAVICIGTANKLLRAVSSIVAPEKASVEGSVREPGRSVCLLWPTK